MKEVQHYLKDFQKEKNWDIPNREFLESKMAILNNYMLLTTEVSEVAEEFRGIFTMTKQLQQSENLTEEEAFIRAKELHKENISKELADCIAYIIKFANYFEIDMEKSFYNKMEEVQRRVNKV
ncbi:MazG nucleotide pyrophosphohydrolase domain-containing protein [Alkalihalobacillus sp. 1P02AB]|uniref:MazG nucleotide pyrophosphohydrolase domain-containing protein n=1 Tax=Alkalihalobacillus sp. 1P02AB TaxID=3132260 RepID=UPI0039A6A5A7